MGGENRLRRRGLCVNSTRVHSRCGPRCFAPRPAQRHHAQTQQGQGAGLWHAVAYCGGGYSPVGENSGGRATKIKRWLKDLKTDEPENWIIGVWEQLDADSFQALLIFAWRMNDTGWTATAKNLVRLVTKTTNDLVKQRLVRGNGEVDPEIWTIV